MRDQERDLGFVRAGFVCAMSAVPRLVHDRRRQPQETLMVQPIGIARATKEPALAVDDERRGAAVESRQTEILNWLDKYLGPVDVRP